MDQSQEILLGHAIFASSEYGDHGYRRIALSISNKCVVVVVVVVVVITSVLVLPRLAAALFQLGQVGCGWTLFSCNSHYTVGSSYDRSMTAMI